MPGPFPGFDPYIEADGYWNDFHRGFIHEIQTALLDVLPEGYDARMDEYLRLVECEPDEPQATVPDVAVVETGRRSARPRASGGGAATLEPVTLPVPAFEEVRDVWLEIRRREDQSVVTVLEVLSPSNKDSRGYGEFASKRQATLRRDINWVEIDLLLEGRRIELGKPLPPGHFYATVLRAASPRTADVYAWSLQDRLPTIPIPLRPPDADVPLDLAAAFATTYERGRYARVLRYDRPADLSVDETTARWIQEQAAGARR